MGVVQVQLPDDLKQVIERQVAKGRASNEADFLAEAVRLYADHLEAEDEIAGMVDRADADLAAGRYVTVATPGDSQALHESAMARLRARLVEVIRRSRGVTDPLDADLGHRFYPLVPMPLRGDDRGAPFTAKGEAGPVSQRQPERLRQRPKLPGP